MMNSLGNLFNFSNSFLSSSSSSSSFSTSQPLFHLGGHHHLQDDHDHDHEHDHHHHHDHDHHHHHDHEHEHEHEHDHDHHHHHHHEEEDENRKVVQIGHGYFTNPTEKEKKIHELRLKKNKIKIDKKKYQFKNLSKTMEIINDGVDKTPFKHEPFSKTEFEKTITPGLLDKESEEAYKILKKRWEIGIITSHPTKTELFEKVMRCMFTPEEAKIVGKVPVTPISVKKLSKKVGITEKQTNLVVDGLAQRGLLYDFYVYDKDRYVAFPDYILGWYEFYWMRIQQSKNLPPKEIAELLEAYQTQTGYYNELYKNGSTYFRTFVREQSLNDEQLINIMDYESVEKIFKNAEIIALSGCGCRLHMKSVGYDVDPYPTNSCFSFNSTARNLIRNGMAKKISAEEGLEVIKYCRSLGMCNTGDNITMPSFICSCEKKYCSVLGAMNVYGKQSFIPSYFYPKIENPLNCIKCGKCINHCPVEAISFQKSDEQKLFEEEEERKFLGEKPNNKDKMKIKNKKKSKSKKTLVIDQDRCLGCGVCVHVCNSDVIKMERRPKKERVVVPESWLERTVRMAVKRKRLHKFIFNDPHKITHKMLGKVAQILEESSIAEALLAIEPLQSKYLKFVIKAANIAKGHVWEKI